ncbi:hypothetical protein Dvina_16295 [Dactylosporangium vinaceum]|uniref:Tetratricopeptide repeat protein n=1 Tax=Dactylosporangium vinaceum TaxID=53362 RepID=A0ABV5M8Y9_9ACTN|nr:tetratricopeptide repeat protein [Dactylosporangium vinaceum]UAB99488.1 hypothetical protein Dvina_16295 [Dactylosporangium vinaceum]
MNPLARLSRWTVRTNLQLAEQSLRQGDFEAAMARFEDDLKVRRRIAERTGRVADREDVARAAVELARLYTVKAVHFDRLAAAARVAYDIYRELDRPLEVGVSARLLAGAYANLRQWGDAGVVLGETFGMLRAVLPDDPGTIHIGHVLALNLEVREDFAGAAELMEDLLERSRRVHGVESAETNRLEWQAGRVLAAVGRVRESIELFERLRADALARGDERGAETLAGYLEQLRG